jgi:hypothetical protein
LEHEESSALKIVVHERSEPYKKKNYNQRVDVYFNFEGKVRAREKPQDLKSCGKSQKPKISLLN